VRSVPSSAFFDDPLNSNILFLHNQHNELLHQGFYKRAIHIVFGHYREAHTTTTLFDDAWMVSHGEAMQSR